MTALVFLLVLGLVFAVAWAWLNRRPNPRAKLGPDGTNVREPETFVVHHEGKGGGDMVRLSDPPPDVSRYGDEKVAPGATPGQPDAETKEQVLMEGPKGSRPATPEQPGSPYSKGRRATDGHRDVELAADLLPNAEPGHKRRHGRELAAGPATDSNGEGGRVIHFRGRMEGQAKASAEMAAELDWTPLFEEIPLPANWGEEATVVMVRNPRSLYVYWERAGYGDENLKSMLGEAEFSRSIPCLRVYDVASGAWPGQPDGRVFNLDVNDFADHWFVQEGIEPGHEYIVSYGRRTADGRFYLLSHSTPIRTPADYPTPESLAMAGMLYQYYVRQPGEYRGQGGLGDLGGQTDPHHPGSQWR